MRRIFVTIGIITMLAGIGYVVRAWSTWRVNARATKLNVDVDNIFTGLQEFKDHVGAYPTGSNAEIVKALMGKNAKNVIILVGRKTDLNTQGEMVDPWGTPLRIYFAGEGILVRSAGPNRRFDDSSVVEADDYIRSN